MTGSVLHRLKILERQKPGTLIAQCHHTETGEVKIMPLCEMIKDFPVWELDRIVAGNNLHDLDTFLSAFREKVNT